MSYNGKRMHEAAERLTNALGISRLMREADERQIARQPKRQIVLPAVAIAGSAAFLVATLFGYAWAAALGGVFIYVALWAQQHGPIRLRDVRFPYDEREQIIIWRSRSIGLGVALCIPMLACLAFFFLVFYQSVNTDEPFAVRDVVAIETLEALLHQASVAIAVMWFMLTTAVGVTTITASLMLPNKLLDREE